MYASAQPGTVLSLHQCIITISHWRSTSFANNHLLLCSSSRLAGHKQPPDSDEETNTRTDAERSSRANLVDDGAAGEATNEERDNADDLVVAADHSAVPDEQLRVGHELAPYGGEHN